MQALLLSHLGKIQKLYQSASQTISSSNLKSTKMRMAFNITTSLRERLQLTVCKASISTTFHCLAKPFSLPPTSSWSPITTDSPSGRPTPRLIKTLYPRLDQAHPFVQVLSHPQPPSVKQQHQQAPTLIRLLLAISPRTRVQSWAES